MNKITTSYSLITIIANTRSPSKEEIWVRCFEWGGVLEPDRLEAVWVPEATESWRWWGEFHQNCLEQGVPRLERGSAQRDDRGFTKLSWSAQCLKNERLWQWGYWDMERHNIWYGIQNIRTYSVGNVCKCQSSPNTNTIEIQWIMFSHCHICWRRVEKAK